MKNLLKIIFTGMFIVIASVASISSPPPCECCETEHQSVCLNCENVEVEGYYNCGTIDPIIPQL